MSSLVHSPSAHTQLGASKTVADLLTAAANLVSQPGRWSQGGTKDARGGDINTQHRSAHAFGLIEAIYRVEPKNDPLREAAIDYVCRVPGVGRGPAAWNDMPGRTQAQVVTALLAAASIAREHGR